MKLPSNHNGITATLLSVFAVAMHLYFLTVAIVNQSYLTDDSIQYLTIAENMSQSGVFSQSLAEPLASDTQRSPGYPTFLLILGRLPLAVLLVQHLLVFLTAWLIFKLLDLIYNKKFAVIGARFYLLMPYPAIFASYILSETLFIFLLVSAFYFYARARFAGNLKWTIGAISILAIASYVRPIALPLVALLLLMTIVQAYRSKEKSWALLTIFAMLPILILGPWFLRNHEIAGRWTFSTMGDMGMLHGRTGGLAAFRDGKGNGEHALFMAGDSIAALEIGLAGLRSYPEGKQTHETERLAVGMTKLTTRFFGSHPWDATRFELYAFWDMLKGIGYGWSLALSHSKLVAVLSAILQLSCNLLMYLGFLLAIVRRKHWEIMEKVFFATILIVLLVSATAWADGRYRVVVDPALVMLMIFSIWRFSREEFGEIGSIPIVVKHTPQ